MFNLVKTAVLMDAITVPAEVHPETAQMMIMNPLSGGGIAGMFSTHPSTEERITRLLGMAKG
jgi:heat shock protein HtpX